MLQNEKLTQAKYSEFQASLWGAMLIAFGLGVLLATYFQAVAFILILLGIVIHGWGMYKIHQRNK